MKINEVNNANFKTQNFGMLKKSALTSDIQWYAVERYKPDLQSKTMNTVDDLRKWFKNMFDKDYEKYCTRGVGALQEALPWKEGFEKFEGIHPDKWIWQATAFNGLIKEKYMTLFDMEAILDAISIIKDRLSKGKHMFSFSHEYSNVLRKKSLEKYFPGNPTPTGWTKLSKSDDEIKTQEVINDIRRLSCGTNWCTKGSLAAKSVIMNKGDNFYIYFERGIPKIGLRTEKQRIPAIVAKGITIPEEITEASMEIKDKWNRPQKKLFETELAEWIEKYPGVRVWEDDISMFGDGR